MKIIKNNQVDSVLNEFLSLKEEITCPHCESILEISWNDFKLSIWKERWPNGCVDENKRLFITCACCCQDIALLDNAESSPVWYKHTKEEKESGFDPNAYDKMMNTELYKDSVFNTSKIIRFWKCRLANDYQVLNMLKRVDS